MLLLTHTDRISHRQDMMFIIVQTTMETDRCNLIHVDKGKRDWKRKLRHLPSVFPLVYSRLAYYNEEAV